MISVVVLPERIGVEWLIPVHVFASLSHSVLISRPIGDIVTIAGARLAVDLPTVIYPFIAVPVSITPVPVHALVAGSKATSVTMPISIRYLAAAV